MMSVVHIFQIVTFTLFTVVNCEVFRAITNVENFLDTHENLLGNLEQYIVVNNNRLDIFKRTLKEFEEEQENASKDAEKYVENPINAFTLIKRLSTDLERLKTMASNTTGLVWDRELPYPTEEDLTGAAMGIVRQQLCYKLNPTQLTEGNLEGVFGSPMTASDSYNLAMILYKQEYAHAAELLEAVLEKLDNEDIEDSIWNEHSELCRGEINFSPTNASKLYCSYLKRSPFLRLAPIKIEELHKNPDIFLFHDVLTDGEIGIIKEIAKSKLKRDTDINHVEKVTSEVTIDKNAFLDDHNHTIEIVKQRMADFTGLSMPSARLLKVVNYGIGGHLYLHNDVPIVNVGDAVARVLFYMSDVSLGGATVFPRLPLAVVPKKGTALYWKNVHPSGELDRKMLHGSCPVLYGFKWVIQRDILSADQDLLQLCPLAVN